MTDIVERLDKMIASGIYPKEVREACNEIERLRAALQTIAHAPPWWEAKQYACRTLKGK